MLMDLMQSLHLRNEFHFFDDESTHQTKTNKQTKKTRSLDYFSSLSRIDVESPLNSISNILNAIRDNMVRAHMYKTPYGVATTSRQLGRR